MLVYILSKYPLQYFLDQLKDILQGNDVDIVYAPGALLQVNNRNPATVG